MQYAYSRYELKRIKIHFYHGYIHKNNEMNKHATQSSFQTTQASEKKRVPTFKVEHVFMIFLLHYF